jgi:hypothetical protein
MDHNILSRHCEERSDATIQKPQAKNWIASSQGLLAMTNSNTFNNEI